MLDKHTALMVGTINQPTNQRDFQRDFQQQTSRTTTIIPRKHAEWELGTRRSSQEVDEQSSPCKSLLLQLSLQLPSGPCHSFHIQECWFWGWSKSSWWSGTMHHESSRTFFSASGAAKYSVTLLVLVKLNGARYNRPTTFNKLG